MTYVHVKMRERERVAGLIGNLVTMQCDILMTNKSERINFAKLELVQNGPNMLLFNTINEQIRKEKGTKTELINRVLAKIPGKKPRKNVFNTTVCLQLP